MIDTIDIWYYTSPMAMGKRKRDRQPTMWVPTTDLPTAASHPFYRRSNQLLREHGFDDFVEAQCAGFHAETIGESYEEFLTKLAKASGIGTPTRADLARIDRKRKCTLMDDVFAAIWSHTSRSHATEARISHRRFSLT